MKRFSAHRPSTATLPPVRRLPPASVVAVLPLPAVLALVSSLGSGGVLGVLPEGSREAVEGFKLVGPSGRLTRFGERVALAARGWLATPEAEDIVSRATQSARVLLSTLSD